MPGGRTTEIPGADKLAEITRSNGRINCLITFSFIFSLCLPAICVEGLCLSRHSPELIEVATADAVVRDYSRMRMRKEYEYVNGRC